MTINNLGDMTMTLKCYRIWFDDDTTILLDGESELAVRQEVEQGIIDDTYHAGYITEIECLDE